MPCCKALLTLLAIASCPPAIAQYPGEPSGGPALVAPVSAPAATASASGSAVLSPGNQPAFPPEQIPPGPIVSQPAPGASQVLPPGASPSAGVPLAQPVPPAAGKEMVMEVRIVGNTLPVEKIKPFIRTREGRPFDKDLVAEDVRRLDSSKMFVNIKTYFQNVPGGKIVIFDVLERPILLDVKFVGNDKVSKKRLQKEAGLKAGDPLDPFAVEEARRKIEEYYRTSGYNKARITLLEGDKPKDRRAIFLVNEGVKQKVQIVTFVGNSIASDARLRTQIHTGAPWVYLFKGELDRKELDEDVDRLTAYYRGLGFFRARIGREVREYDPKEDGAPDIMASRAFKNIDQFETVQWVVVRFIIDEGPRYKIGSVSVAGNTKYTSEQLMADLKLKGGDYFNQNKMTADVNSVKDKYGGVGYVFADVKADPRFLDQPGTLDLVYRITEGNPYRVGKIDVQIKGEFPHTKITTVMNRLSVHPGDIADIREIRASERRLRASQLFEANPANGSPPKIVYSPPDKEGDEEEDNPTQMARKPRSPKFRSQSPDMPTNGAPPTRYRELNLVLEATAANPDAWDRLPVETPRAGMQVVQTASAGAPPAQPVPSASVPPAQPVPPSAGAPQYYQPQNYQPQNYQPQNYQLPPPGYQNSPQPMPIQQQNQQGDLIIRGQYTPDAGHSTPQVYQRPTWTGARPAAVTAASTTSADNTTAAPQYQSNQAYPSYQNGSAAATPQYTQPQYSQPQYSQQQYSQQPGVQPSYSQAGAPPAQSAPASAGQTYPAQSQTVSGSNYQYVQPYNNPYPAGQTETIPPGASVPLAQPGPSTSQQPAPCPYNAAGASPPPDRIVDPVLTPGSPFNPLTIDPNDPTRLLPMNVTAEETQTGRFMFGVGVTSDAGLTGTIKIDEQNFDLFNIPRSWEDVKNFTAWRGNGQRLVIEAYPGTQVQRYAISFEEPYLCDSAVTMGLSGYYFSRAYTEWFETRIGGRVALGYQFSPDLAGTIAYRGARVGISQIIDSTIPDLAEMQGDNALHGFQISLAHNTRDNPILATECHLIQGSV